MKLKILHLYPDLLNLYGDRGNLICMRRRLEWRGIECEITELPAGKAMPEEEFDLYFLGSGQDTELDAVLSDLAGEKGEALRAAAENGKVFLAVNTGMQLLGRARVEADGTEKPMLGIVDFVTTLSAKRAVGNYSFDCLLDGVPVPVVGFENHAGRTQLGEGVSPLGRIRRGSGNNGADGAEGVRWKNVFGTYSHGPVLPKNPALCDHILLTALRLRHPEAELAPLDDSLEFAARDQMLAIIEK